MSKSRGTVIRPLDLVTEYGLDAFRYFLLREMVFGLDANFNEDALVQRLNADLANDLGNLFSRTLAMTAKFFDGKVPPFGSEPEELDRKLLGKMEEAVRQLTLEIPKFGFHKALMAIWDCINEANRYIDYVAPWSLAKDPGLSNRLQTVIRNLLEINRVTAVLISPFMPQTAEKMLERLGKPKASLDLRMAEDGRWGTLEEGASVMKGESLFPRVDLKERKEPSEKASAPPVQPQEEKAELITFEEFKKVDLRVGVVKHAERVPKAKKLLRLIVDIGEERQVVAGIAQTHAPEDIIGKQVVIVANLQPAKLMGIESHGMVLAVRDDDTLRLLTTEKAVKPGLRVS